MPQGREKKTKKHRVFALCFVFMVHLCPSDIYELGVAYFQVNVFLPSVISLLIGLVKKQLPTNLPPPPASAQDTSQSNCWLETSHVAQLIRSVLAVRGPKEVCLRFPFLHLALLSYFILTTSLCE